MTSTLAPIVVVGAGPAGSVAACRLARAGVPVTLIERQRFPRDKVCGECLSALGMDVLTRLGLRESLTPLSPARLTHTALVAPGGSEAIHPLPQPMWGLTRRQMDAALLAVAESAGARILQPARVERIEPDGPRQRLTCRDADNRLITLDAGLVLLADGKAAFAPAKPPATADLGVKLHLTGVNFDPHTIALFTLDGHYGGLAPVEPLDGVSLWNIALSVPDARVRGARGDLERIWADAMARQPFLARTCGHATRVGPILASPLPRFAVQPRWTPGQIPLGNAAAALEPIGGEGMGLAMRSAELATDAVLTALQADKPLDVESLRAAYRQLWRLRRAACRGVAMAMSRPTLARGLVPLSSIAGWGTRWVLHLMGKNPHLTPATP